MVGIFVHLAHRHLTETNSFRRLAELTAPDSVQTPDEVALLANSIDRQITRALLSAEKNCKKHKLEPWSEELHFASLHVKYWRLKGAANAINTMPRTQWPLSAFCYPTHTS